MPPIEDEDMLETLTGTFTNVTGDGTVPADTDLIVVEVDHMAQLTNLRITGGSTENYDVVVRDQDASNPSVEQTYVGSDIDEGKFENPAVRNIGAQKEVAIINRTQLDDDNYGVNVEVDQLERGVEG